MKKTVRILLLLSATLTLGSAPLFGQRKLAQELKKTVQSVTTSVPTVQFNANDPFDKKNFVTKGTPWEENAVEPVELPEGVNVVLPDPLPDIAEVSTARYNAAVSEAFVGMQMIYGDMSEQDAKAFSDMWSPLYDCPSQEIIDYLNKLNPLISQFLVTRQNMIESLSAYEELLFEAAEAADWGDKEVFDEIMDQVKVYAESVKLFDAVLREIANRIGALGNPPNPFEYKAAARRQYNRIFQNKKKEPFLGESWMGTKLNPDYHCEGVAPLTEPMFRYLLRTNVAGVGERYFVVQLSESGAPTPEELKEDPEGLATLKVVQVDCDNSDGKKPIFTSDGEFRTYFPKPPTMAITMLTMSLMSQFEMSYPTDEDRKTPGLAQSKQEFHDAAGNFGNRVLRAGYFFKVCYEWSGANKWSEYEFTEEDSIPDDCLDDLAEEMRKQMREYSAMRAQGRKARAEAAKAASIPITPEQIRQKEVEDSIARDRQSKLESIAEREAIIENIRKSIREKEKIREGYISLYQNPPTEQDAKMAQKQIEELNYQIMHLTADISDEQNYIQGLQTGEYHHTWNAFDEYARVRNIINTNKECERYSRAKHNAAALYRMVNRLPLDEQQEARARVDKLLIEDQALAKGDPEAMAKLGKVFQHKAEGKEYKEQSDIQNEIAWIDIKETAAVATVMACGSLTAGIASSGLAATYGAEAAATIYGAKAFGAMYAGLTGYLSGGPGKAASSVAGSLHPAAGVVGSFLEGFYSDEAKGLSFAERWQIGTNAATTDLILSAAFDAGTFIAVKGITAVAPRTKMNLFAPKKPKLDMLKTQRQRLEAQDAVKSFGTMCESHNKLVASGAPKAQIDASQTKLNEMAASLNSDYHAKWYLKYKADPKVRTAFDGTLQKNYDAMIPKMSQRLADQGYDMSDIKFQQFRNSASKGSSSMDLDLAPVSIKKDPGNQPKFFKHGKEVTPGEFMEDAQKAMNMQWKEDFKLSGKLSEMNLTTSAHPEAFSNPELLKKDIDFTKVKAEDVASIGKVLEVKVNTIEGNKMMTQTTKMQAKCREASKEISNMLMPKLKSDLSQCKPGSKEYKAIQGDIRYWERMEKQISRIGKETSDPVELHKINIEIQSYTGGKDATQVVNDLIHTFNPSFKVQ